MSHFVLLVVGPNYVEQLAPFNEELEVPPTKVYVDDEEYNKIIREYTEEELAAFGSWDNICRDWYGDEGGEDETGHYRLNDRNPNAKWDWYAVGGRWAGLLPLKEGTIGKISEPSWQNREERYAKIKHEMDTYGTIRTADQARKCDIDWDEMDVRAERDRHTSWQEAHDPKTPNNPKFRTLLYGILPEDTEESYVARRHAFYTHAVLMDGKWYEKGKMGMFGFTYDEKDPEAWQKEFQKMLDQLPDDTLLTIVDCHI